MPRRRSKRLQSRNQTKSVTDENLNISNSARESSDDEKWCESEYASTDESPKQTRRSTRLANKKAIAEQDDSETESESEMQLPTHNTEQVNGQKELPTVDDAQDAENPDQPNDSAKEEPSHTTAADPSSITQAEHVTSEEAVGNEIVDSKEDEWGDDWQWGCCNDNENIDSVGCDETGCNRFWHFTCLEQTYQYTYPEIVRMQEDETFHFTCPTCQPKKKPKKGRKRKGEESDDGLIDDSEMDYVEPPPVGSLNIPPAAQSLSVIAPMSNMKLSETSSEANIDRDVEMKSQSLSVSTGQDQDGDATMNDASSNSITVPLTTANLYESVAASRPRRILGVTNYRLYESEHEEEGSDEESDSESVSVDGMFDGMEITEEQAKLIAERLKAHQNQFQGAMKRQRQLRLQEIKNQCKFTIDIDLNDEEASFILDFCTKHQFDVMDKLEEEGMFFIESMREMMQEKKRQIELGMLRRKKKKRRGYDDSESEWEIDTSSDDDDDSDFSFDSASEDEVNLIEEPEDDWVEQMRARKRAARKNRRLVNPKPGFNLDGTRRAGRLLLDDAMKNKDSKEGWSEARINAYEKKETNPNSYYYRFLDEGFEQGHGPFTPEEHKLFMQRMMEFGVNDKWGEFSMTIPQRVGYQCSNYYRDLIKKKWVLDPNYFYDTADRKLHFKRGIPKSKKKHDMNHRIKSFAFTVYKDPSGVWKDLPAQSKRRPPESRIEPYMGPRAAKKAGPKKKKTTKKSKVVEEEETKEEQKKEEETKEKAESTETSTSTSTGDASEESEKKDGKKKKSKKKDKKKKDKKDKKKKSKDKKKKKSKKKSGKKDKKKKGKDESEGTPEDGETKETNATNTTSTGTENAEKSASESSDNDKKTKRKRKRKRKKPSSDDSGDDLTPPTKRRRTRNSKGKKKKGKQSDDDDGDETFQAKVRVEPKRKYFEENNPLPELIDIITGDVVQRPAISPYGHVLGYDTWCKLLRREQSKNTCPFTRQHLTRRSLVCLTHENFDEYKDQIRNFSEEDKLNAQ